MPIKLCLDILALKPHNFTLHLYNQKGTAKVIKKESNINII